MYADRTAGSTRFSAEAFQSFVYASVRISFFGEFQRDPYGFSCSPSVYHRRMQSVQCAPNWMHRPAIEQTDMLDSIVHHTPSLIEQKEYFNSCLSKPQREKKHNSSQQWFSFRTGIVATVEPVQAILNIESDSKFSMVIVAVELIFCGWKKKWFENWNQAIHRQSIRIRSKNRIGNEQWRHSSWQIQLAHTSNGMWRWREKKTIQ